MSGACTSTGSPAATGKVILPKASKVYTRTHSIMEKNQIAINPTSTPTSAQMNTVRPMRKVSPSEGVQKRNHRHGASPNATARFQGLARILVSEDSPEEARQTDFADESPVAVQHVARGGVALC